MRIFVIGSGRMANALAPALLGAGHHITGIHSRNQKTGTSLSKYLRCAFFESLQIPKETELIIVAVNDDATKTVASRIPKSKAIIVHTSGSVDMSALGRKKSAGVFYPLETMSGKRRVAFRKIPVCVEASDEKTLISLLSLAHSLSEHVYVLDSEKRKALHVAAIFTNNFTNHLLGLASEISSQEGVPFRILEQLALTTIKNAFQNHPRQVQTGPARRGDQKTIDRHLAYLKKQPQARELYAMISKQIVAVHKKGKPQSGH